MAIAGRSTLVNRLKSPIWRLLGLLAASAMLIIVFLSARSTMRIARCGFSAAYAEGTIVALPETTIQQPNPHSTVPDYHLGRTPIIKLDIERSREVPADPEFAPSTRSIGDRVQVCYDQQHPGHVRILKPR